MNTALHFASGNDTTGTAWDFFLKLDAEFGFIADMAAVAENTKHPHYYGPDSGYGTDCLVTDWPTGGPVWLNPPYSDAYPFVQKAAEQRYRGVTTVCLLAARTDTRWFHDYIWDADTHCPQEGVEVRFLRGRLKFEGHKQSAPFPSMLAIFHGVA